MQLDHRARRLAEFEAEQGQRSVDQAVRVEFKFRHQTACSKETGAIVPPPTPPRAAIIAKVSAGWKPSGDERGAKASREMHGFRACHIPDRRLLGRSTRF